MIARKSGKIVNIASLMSDLARPTVVPYTAAKGGVRQLTRGMAVELAPHNIQVNAISPGYFATEMNRALIDNVEFNAWVCKRTPAGRWGDPPEIAGLAVFLCSAAANYITGQLITIDGGMSVAVMARPEGRRAIANHAAADTIYTLRRRYKEAALVSGEAEGRGVFVPRADLPGKLRLGRHRFDGQRERTLLVRVHRATPISLRAISTPRSLRIDTTTVYSQARPRADAGCCLRCKAV
jgi:gluconate 5-dehydrogenase